MKIIEDNNKRKYIYLLCDKLEQPIGVLYVSAMGWRIIKDIAFSNPRVFVGFDDDGNEIYRGIQRALSSERVKQIKKYVNEYEYATFPSSIILNFPHEKIDVYDVNLSINVQQDNQDINFDHVEPEKELTDFNQKVLVVFPYENSVAQIIDGQHRMSGFEENSHVEFDLPVTIFIDQTVEQQAEVFSTINGKQTRVTPSLVYELFGISDRPSPYKTAHNIVKVLNEGEASPLRGWFKRLGKSNNYYRGYITQSTANQNIFKLISGNAKQVDEDMRILARRDKLTENTPFSRAGAVLRSFYLEDDEISIIKVLFNFFNAIKELFPNEWDKQDSIFKKTIGFTALFKVMIDLVPFGINQNNLSKDFFISMLKGVDINPKVTLSSKGINEIYGQFKDYYQSKITL